jgi:hypothetical protein
MVTPLWIGEYAGFGAGGFAGVKYDWLDASTGSVSIARFPLGVAAHVLLHIDGGEWLVLRGGLQKEFGVSVSGDNNLAGNGGLQGSLGGFGEGGFYGVFRGGVLSHLAVSVTFRYSVSHDTVAGARFDANSAGFIFAFTTTSSDAT